MELQGNAGAYVDERAGARRTVASYSTYAAAQNAVDFLSDRMFPVERVAIVAEGLRLVEQVTGRLSYGRVAMNGAMSGAFVGGFFGFLFGLFNWVSPVISAFSLALYGILYGVILGAALSAIFHAFTGGKRDFSSVGAIGADRYNLMVDASLADEAVQLLGSMASAGQGNASPRPAISMA